TGRDVSIIKRKDSSVTNGTALNTGMIFTTGPANGTLYTSSSRGSFVLFERLTVDGGDQTGLSSDTPGQHGIYAPFTDDVQLHEVVAQHCWNEGIFLVGGSRSVLNGCSALSNGRMTVAGRRNG